MVKTEKIWIEITESSLKIADACTFVNDEQCGAVNMFIGTVRNYFENRPVKGIEYHGYPEMGEKVLEKIVSEAQFRWDVKKTVVHHRLGKLELKEASVVVAVSTGHRNEAYDACRFIMEEIKKDLPVWKKELYADESSLWH